MYRFVLMELLGKGISEGNIWLSLERRMKCGVGKCGHCQINHLYACQYGPSFSLRRNQAPRGGAVMAPDPKSRSSISPAARAAS